MWDMVPHRNPMTSYKDERGKILNGMERDLIKAAQNVPFASCIEFSSRCKPLVTAGVEFFY